MALDGIELNPGHMTLHPCPECGADWVGRREGADGELEYYCEACGETPAKDEVQKSLLEVFNEAGTQVAWPTPSRASIDQITDADLRRRVDDKRTGDWILTEVSPSGTKAILTKTKGGSFLAHLITLFLTIPTLGMGNYALHHFEKYRNRETLVLRASDTATEPDAADGDPPQEATERIKQLEALRDDGILTEEEYQQKRDGVIDGL